MKYGVPQGSVLGPLLIYINQLNFADDTNLLVVGNSLKSIQQKQINLDLKNLWKWLKANKISLNASKTELIIFRNPRKKSVHELKIKIDGKLIPCKFVKYLGIFIDSHLNWNAHSTATSAKLSRAIGMLCKVRHFVKHETLVMIYYGIFSSILIYSSQIWGQTNGIVKMLQILQNKALRIINFKPRRASASLCGKFALDTVHNNRNETYFQIDRPTNKTFLYGSRSIKSSSVDIWNFINAHSYQEKLQEKSRSICKTFVSKFLLNRY